MTKVEFLEVLLAESVRFGRVNGFSLEYSDNGGDCLLKGRIPLTLARKICEGADTKEFGISVHHGSYLDKPEEWATNADLADMLSECVYKIRRHGINGQKTYDEKKAAYILKAEQDGKLDDIYVLYFHIDTPNGLSYVINTIRESGYINQCIWSS